MKGIFVSAPAVRASVVSVSSSAQFLLRCPFGSSSGLLAVAPLQRVSSRRWGSCPMAKCAPNYGELTKSKRRGRGPNQPIGKGRKGAKIKQGNRIFHRGYEGKQTPIHKSPPRFFWNKYDHNAPLQWLDIEKLERYLDKGVLYKDRVIRIQEMHRVGLIPDIKWGLALVNNHKLKQFKHRIHIEVTFVTPTAKRAIEAAGGIVRLRYIPKMQLRWFQYPHEMEFKQFHSYDRLPRPRWRHMFPDYPQLPVKEELKYLGKYQVHPQLLPKHVGEAEKKEQSEKLALNDNRPPRPYLLTHTNLKDKLFRWARYKLHN